MFMLTFVISLIWIGTFAFFLVWLTDTASWQQSETLRQSLGVQAGKQDVPR